MSKKVPCSKCGREFTTQGIKNHELRCDGTIPESKEPISFSEPSNDVIEPADETTGIKTYSLPKSNPETREIKENRDVHVQKHDFGWGIVIALILFAGIVIYVISNAGEIISKIPRKEIIKEVPKDGMDGFL